MAIHVIAMLIARRVLSVPIFFIAVSSKANIGGAASAPIVAGAFHPALAPVGGIGEETGDFAVAVIETSRPARADEAIDLAVNQHLI